MDEVFSQAGYDIRSEWGARGLEVLLPGSDAVIIVDVLSFTTAVAVAVSQGAIVFPYRFRDASAPAYARRHDARLAGSRATGGYSLSPSSLARLRPGERIVLPSPNGSTLSLATGGVPTYAGCLRNAAAVAAAARRHGPSVAVIAAGERWPDGSLRPALEDALGAGAIVAALAEAGKGGTPSPEAAGGAALFDALRPRLAEALMCCASGRELAAKGYSCDVAMASELDADAVAPCLRNGAYAAETPA